MDAMDMFGHARDEATYHSTAVGIGAIFTQTDGVVGQQAITCCCLSSTATAARRYVRITFYQEGGV